MLFSIVTPVYNPPNDFLHRAINSITLQNFSDWEWILVNDNSIPSQAIEEIESVAKGSKQVHLLSNRQNKNISYSTNKAISVARGQWIIFLIKMIFFMSLL